MTTNRSYSLPALTLAFVLGSSCGWAQSTSTDSAVVAAKTPVPASMFSRELLELAFEAASAIPRDTNAKDRARAQEQVVDALITVHLLGGAERCAASIDSWRQGSAYASLAVAFARDGDARNMDRCARLATLASADALDWQRERVAVKIGSAHAWLGQDALAATRERGVGEPEQGKIAAVRAARAQQPLSDEAFDAALKELDVLVATHNCDLVRNASRGYIELYAKSFSVAARRERIIEGIDRATALLSYDLRIENALGLAEVAIVQKDNLTAQVHLAQADAVLAHARWLPIDQISQMARIAACKHDAGAVEQAREQLDAALAMFDASRAAMTDIERATPLRALAAAWADCDERAKALECYARALTEGASNQNARPRAEDLVATSASMSVHDIEPSAVVWLQLRAIRSGLRDPW